MIFLTGVWHKMLSAAVDFIFMPLSCQLRMSGCNVTGRRVKVERYSLPATTIHMRSYMTFPAFDFSIVSYTRLLFQLQDQYCFLLMKKQQIIHTFIWNKALGAFHLNTPPYYIAFGDSQLAGRWRAEKQLLTWLFKNFFSELCVHKQCSQCSSSCIETLVYYKQSFMLYWAFLVFQK